MKAVPPGDKANWTSLLKEPWCLDPEVVVVQAPENAVLSTRETDDHETEFLCMQIGDGPIHGLQIIKPEFETYSEHNIAFRGLNGKMVTPAYFGKLSAIPSKYLYGDGMPLVFVKDNMSTPYLHLKQALHTLTKKEDRACN